MRILLDECVDERLRHEFLNHDCQTARYAGLAGLKNGELLAAAEAAGFEVVVTVDQSISYQQNLTAQRVAILVLCARTNRLEHIRQLIPAAVESLRTLQPGAVLTVS